MIKKTFGEILIIIGGFILAETIVRNFIELSEGQFPLWLIPVVGIVLITGGMQLREKGKLPIFDTIYWIWMILTLVLILFINRGLLLSEILLVTILIVTIILVIVYPSYYLFKKFF